MSSMRKILIIEDDSGITHIVKDYLVMSGFDTYISASGMEGLKNIGIISPDFIILDIMLPDMDGIDVCRQIRNKTDIPILVLSAKGSDTDKVIALGFGADDYMTKPFSLSELVARINAHLRRYQSLNAANDGSGAICLKNIVIDKNSYTVTVNNKAVKMSGKEFELLCFLAQHKNQVFSKSQLLDSIWGYEEYGDINTITVYIRRIREKIEEDPSNPVYIKTVWGIGYKFSLD